MMPRLTPRVRRKATQLRRPTDDEGRPLSERRLLENEKLCRRLNRKVEELDRLIGSANGRDPGASLTHVPGFFCECSDAECLSRLPLDHDEYDRVHRRADHFVVAPGHETPGVEDVVERLDGWLVVEKHVPPDAPELQG
jgi:hypothetical protein